MERKEKYKIAVAGTGYVGLSNAILLAQHQQVQAVDVLQEKVDKINRKESPIIDKEIQEYLSEKDLDLTATVDGESAYSQADFVIISTPTNYDPVKNYFDTGSVEQVMELVQKCNPEAVMVVKSTVPVGYTRKMQERYPKARLLFSPEFLREGRALYDNLYPSRIIVGAPDGDAELQEAARDFCRAFGRRGIEKKKFPHFLWRRRRRRQSSFLPTRIWRCGWHILTNWIRMRRYMV